MDQREFIKVLRRQQYKFGTSLDESFLSIKDTLINWFLLTGIREFYDTGIRQFYDQGKGRVLGGVNPTCERYLLAITIIIIMSLKVMHSQMMQFNLFPLVS